MAHPTIRAAHLGGLAGISINTPLSTSIYGDTWTNQDPCPIYHKIEQIYRGEVLISIKVQTPNGIIIHEDPDKELINLIKMLTCNDSAARGMAEDIYKSKYDQ